MVDLSVFNVFTPASFDEIKSNTDGAGISFEDSLNAGIKDKDAEALAQIIRAKTKDLDDEDKLAQIERSLAYIRGKGGSELSLEVYEKIKNEDSNEFIDVFGRNDNMPSNIQTDSAARSEWDKIMSGAAYDYIEENKESIDTSIKAADKETKNGKTIYDVDDNQSLSKLKNQLIENGMDGEDADADISKMLREKGLLKENESVKISVDSSESLSETDKKKGLEKLRTELTEKVKNADSPEEVQKILEASVDELEKYRPKNGADEPEKFYTEEMQKILNDADKGYYVAATPALEKNKNGDIKVKVDGKVSDSVFVNSDGEFVGKDGKELKERTKDGTEQVQVGDRWIDKEDIKPSDPKINVYVNEKKNNVEDKAIEEGREYIEDSKDVHTARGDKEAVKELGKKEKTLDAAEEALKKKRESGDDKDGKDNTLMMIVGIISAIATVVAALSQGSGKTVTVSDSGGYNRGGGGGYGYGSYYANDKYGYNRGYETTVAKAYERSNQYLSTIYDNPVRTRASIMRKNGMAAIQGQNGYTSPIYQ